MESPLYLLALVLLLVISAGFTIGLTYAPCFASLCSEQFFPWATRVHIAGFYGMVASIGIFLLARAYIPWIHKVSSTYVIRRELPVLRKRISLGGLTLAIWIVALTVASTGFWIDPESNFWSLRTDPLRWPDAKIRLAVTGIIGHHCDILLGLVVIPVSRNSILGRAFSLHQSTLLYAHKLLAYAFLIVVIAHGGAYYTFVATYGAADDTSPRKDAFNIDNPTFTIAQSEAQSTYWSYLTLPTGMLAFIVMVVITITALPVLRRRSYNTFYYVHVIGSVLVFFFSSIHASTDFYFLVPGLLLWISDWAWRLLRGDAGGLTKKVTGILEDAGHGWYRLTLPPSASLLKDGSAGEKGSDPTHPLQTYYINIPSVSKLENHAFTAAKVETRDSGPVLLFQRSTPWSPKRKQAKQDKEWTWKVGVAAGVDSEPIESEDAIEVAERRKEVEARIEGPYIPHEMATFQSADKIVCIVGGTGLTGAYSLAKWWLATRLTEPNASFTLVWTVRHRETALLSEWRELEDNVRLEGSGRISLRVHVSSEEGRVDVSSILREQFNSHSSDAETRPEGKEAQSHTELKKAWVYVSGPEGLLRQAEDACVNLEHELRAAKRKRPGDGYLAIDTLEHYVAKWEV